MVQYIGFSRYEDLLTLHEFNSSSNYIKVIGLLPAIISIAFLILPGKDGV